MKHLLALALLLAVAAQNMAAITAGEVVRDRAASASPCGTDSNAAVEGCHGPAASASPCGTDSNAAVEGSDIGRAMQFDGHGEFKIVQFTDLHYNTCKAESRIVLKRMREVLRAEKPDLIVFTGDLIYSKPADKALDEILAVVSEFGIPFCAVLGNHDPDFDTREHIYDKFCSYPGCIMAPRRTSVGVPDYAVPIASHDGSADAAILYFIDSNAHLFENGKFIGYDSVHPEQVRWYCETSEDFKSANGGSVLPALAFLHIPLPEFHNAVADENCPLIGTRMEYACSPALNTGLFDAFKACGDVMAVFVGHDHDNDYATVWQDILLAYGRYTGGNTEYNNLPNGARVIVLKEGKRRLDSWIVLKGGAVKDRITFPDSFTKSDWRTRPLDPECK